MIDLATEHWFRLSEAKRKLPTEPSYMTVWRWHRHGKKTGRKCIKLEVQDTAHGLVTSIEAYLRFQSAIASARSSR